METVSRQECQYNHKNMGEKIDKINDKIDKVSVDLAMLPERLMEKMDERYASKDTERNLRWLTRLVVGAVVVALLGVIIKNQ